MLAEILAGALKRFVGLRGAELEYIYRGGGEKDYYERKSYLGRFVGVHPVPVAGGLPKLRFSKGGKRYLHILGLQEFPFSIGFQQEDEDDDDDDENTDDERFKFDELTCFDFVGDAFNFERYFLSKDQHQRRIIELYAKIIDKDGTIQLREGQIQVTKKLLSVISPVFKKAFEEGDVITIADQEPADVRLFIDLVTGMEMPSGFKTKLAILTKLVGQFQCGSILDLFIGCQHLIDADIARQILDIKPMIQDDKLLKICRDCVAEDEDSGEEDSGEEDSGEEDTGEEDSGEESSGEEGIN